MNDSNETAAGIPAASPMEQFFTAEAANQGIKVPLVDPAGNRTEHWLQIYGVDSDHFRIADARAKRALAKTASLPEDERDLAVRDLVRALTAELVFAWSFPQECTHANVVEFFRKAPQVQESVDFFASRRAFFTAKSSSNFSPTPPTNSGSTSPRKAAARRSGKA